MNGGKHGIECPLCFELFASTFSKNRHIQLKHEIRVKKHLTHIKKGKKFVCKVCRREYSHSRDLKKHYISKHDKHDLEDIDVPLQALFHKDIKAPKMGEIQSDL